MTVPDSLSYDPAGLRTLILVGFMGAGKTSVGRALGARLGWEFVDLDDWIAARSERSVEQIFAESGEPEFRRLEVAAVRELLRGPVSRRVIALGGGAFAHSDVIRLVAESGAVTVFLDAPVDELYRRCGDDQKQRPLKTDMQQFCNLYGKRRSAYERAYLRIDTSGKDIDTVATEVACGLGVGTLK